MKTAQALNPRDMCLSADRTQIPFATGESKMDFSRKNRLVASFVIIHNTSNIVIHL